MTAAEMRDMGEHPAIPLAVVETVAPKAAADIAMQALTALLTWRVRELTQPMTAMQVLEHVERLRDVADRLSDALDAAGRAGLGIKAGGVA